MKYVQADWDEEAHGFRVDPRQYLAVLPALRGALPAGAWAYASAPEHYTFSSPRCVKDLELVNITLPVQTTHGTDGSATLTFAPNQWKHDEALRIECTGVTHFAIDYERSIDWTQTITLLLDEVLPSEAVAGGATHELELTDAKITVHCTDLTATWGNPPG
ncbi:hypothetical protein [Streptomyces sp. NPDC055189]